MNENSIDHSNGLPPQQAHINAEMTQERVSGDSRPALNDGARIALDVIQRLDLFKHVTNLSAFGFTIFYIYAMKSGFNPENVFASTPSVIHVIAAIGISLSMFQLQSSSLMRVVHALGLLLLANLG